MAENGRTYFDRQEVRDPIERERSIFHALPGLIRHAIDNAPYFREHLAGVDPDAVATRADLARIPLVKKPDLEERQYLHLPFGGMAATATGRLAHLYCSPGQLYGLEGTRSDYWRFARAMYAAGFRRGDIVLNGFDYHLVPDGFMADFGARAMGCPVIPAGTANLDQQVRVVADLAPVAYTGRPSALMALLERAAAHGGSASTSLQKALLAGEVMSEDDGYRLARDYGIEAFQCYATPELGLVAYETAARDGFVVDESMIVEVIDPETGRPPAQLADDCSGDGPIGEVVVTAFNPDYPLIRFATGDLSAIVPGESSCGRTNMRLRGMLGRVHVAKVDVP